VICREAIRTLFDYSSVWVEPTLGEANRSNVSVKVCPSYSHRVNCDHVGLGRFGMRGRRNADVTVTLYPDEIDCP
jgi:hypothetical protein